MTGFFKNRPTVGHKNAPGRKIWLTGKDGIKFAINTGGRRAGPKQRELHYSVTHLVVPTGWIRFDHRLARKRRAL